MCVDVIRTQYYQWTKAKPHSQFSKAAISYPKWFGSVEKSQENADYAQEENCISPTQIIQIKTDSSTKNK